MNQLLQAPAWLLAILSIVLWCLLAGGLGVAGRRFLPAKADDRYSDVQRMLLSVGGIFCGVVVALSVFVVWDHHSGARQAEIDQGAALVALYQDGETLPQPARAQVAAAIRGYTTSMIREEFPALAGGGSSDDTERSQSPEHTAERATLSHVLVLTRQVGASGHTPCNAGRRARHRGEGPGWVADTPHTDRNSAPGSAPGHRRSLAGPVPGSATSSA